METDAPPESAKPGTRIWYQSFTELDKLPEYSSVLTEHLKSGSSADTQVDLHGMRPGTYSRFGRSPVEMMAYPYAFSALLWPVLQDVRTAEREGCDAFLMASFIAPFLREARSAVSIPVVSLAESALLVACSLARRVALICITQPQARLVSELVSQLELDHRVAAITPLDPQLNDRQVSESFTDPGPLVDSFTRASRAGLAAGADAVIPAEGIMSEVLRVHGFGSVDGAPVLDAVSIALRYTTMIAELWKSGAIAPGRLLTYPMPDPEILHVLETGQD